MFDFITQLMLHLIVSLFWLWVVGLIFALGLYAGYKLSLREKHTTIRDAESYD